MSITATVVEIALETPAARLLRLEYFEAAVADLTLDVRGRAYTPPGTFPVTSSAALLAASSMVADWLFVAGYDPGVPVIDRVLGAGFDFVADVVTVEVWAARTAATMTEPWLAFGAGPVNWETGEPYPGDLADATALPVYRPDEALTDGLLADGQLHLYACVQHSALGLADIYRDGIYLWTRALDVDLRSAPASNRWGGWATPERWWIYSVGPVLRLVVYEGCPSPYTLAWHASLLSVPPADHAPTLARGAGAVRPMGDVQAVACVPVWASWASGPVVVLATVGDRALAHQVAIGLAPVALSPAEMHQTPVAPIGIVESVRPQAAQLSIAPVWAAVEG